MSRILAALAPIRGAFWSGVCGVTAGRFGVDLEPMLVVSVRVRAKHDPEGWLPGEPRPAHAGWFEECLPVAGDAVPLKSLVDVDVSFDGADILRERDVEITVGTGSGEQRMRVDLRSARAELPALVEGLSVSRRRDGAKFQLVAPASRVAGPVASVGWSIDRRVAASGPIAFGLAARADFTDGEHQPIELAIDGVRVSLRDRSVELTYRGWVPERTLVERVVLGVVPAHAARAEASELLAAGLPNASFAWAANVEDAVQGRPPPELAAEERDAARVSAWSDGPGEPSLEPDEYRAIASELARRPRAEVLADYGFDEIGWTREEWAVAERLARASRELGDADTESGAEPSLDRELEAWVTAIRPSSGGGELDLGALARLSAHLSARDPGRVLRDANLTVAELARMEEALERRLSEDPQAEQQFDALFEAARPEAEALAAREAAADLGDEGGAA
ncbi:MAG: hypothetical protein U0414_24605 [Polyangiaceae bacterium]